MSLFQRHVARRNLPYQRPDNESCDFLLVTSGVPQGSILGPLLSLLFINDMPNAISKETSLPSFADDLKCFQVILGRDDGIKLQDDLNK